VALLGGVQLGHAVGSAGLGHMRAGRLDVEDIRLALLDRQGPGRALADAVAESACSDRLSSVIDTQGQAVEPVNSKIPVGAAPVYLTFSI